MRSKCLALIVSNGNPYASAVAAIRMSRISINYQSKLGDLPLVDLILSVFDLLTIFFAPNGDGEQRFSVGFVRRLGGDQRINKCQDQLLLNFIQ